jgi:hypothetical protein
MEIGNVSTMKNELRATSPLKDQLLSFIYCFIIYFRWKHVMFQQNGAAQILIETIGLTA